MTPATKVAGGQPVWTRDSITEALRRYFELYGELTAACFSPSSAKWADRQDLIDRYYAGDPDTGLAWPSLNSIKGAFENSFNVARAAIGLEPNRAGPSRRKAGMHRPVRDVRERVQTRVVERHADPRWGARLAEAEVREVRVEVPAPGDARLRKRVTTLEQRMAKAAERLREARARAAEARTRASTATRKAEQLQRRLSAAEETLASVVSSERATVAAAERAEARLAELSEQSTAALAELTARAEAAELRVGELEADLELVDEAEMARARKEVESARGRVAAAQEAQHGAERLAAVAQRERRAAVATAERSERQAVSAERERRRVLEATVGHARKLTAAQVEALRERGPQGPVVFMDAVKAVVRAQSKGQREELRAALRRAAAAAIGWSDRL